MLYTKIQPQSFLNSGEELSVLPYLGMAAILFNGTEAFAVFAKTFEVLQDSCQSDRNFLQDSSK